MRIDLPLCSFEYCRYNFDCNCTDKSRNEHCEFDTYKNLFEGQNNVDNMELESRVMREIKEELEKEEKH